MDRESVVSVTAILELSTHFKDHIMIPSKITCFRAQALVLSQDTHYRVQF